MSYGTMIRGWREQRGWTQRQLAEAIGCTDGYVAHLENEVKLPSTQIIMGVTEVFDLSRADEQQLLQAVEAVRQQRAERRLRTRGAVVRGALRTRGSARSMPAKPEPEDLDADRIARDLDADPELRTAYAHLKRGLADPRMRQTVLNALRAFARESESS